MTYFELGNFWISLWKLENEEVQAQLVQKQATQGSGHGPRPAEFKKLLDNARWVCIFGSPAWSQELDSVIPVGPFPWAILWFCSIYTNRENQDWKHADKYL